MKTSGCSLRDMQSYTRATTLSRMYVPVAKCLEAPTIVFWFWSWTTKSISHSYLIHGQVEVLCLTWHIAGQSLKQYAHDIFNLAVRGVCRST
ncbi:hypothetical protein BDL97_01G104700 [Sphagnum fallax]|nr:hypothetical protein BDL97_01G104700 [Sphagnum fallax]